MMFTFAITGIDVAGDADAQMFGRKRGLEDHIAAVRLKPECLLKIRDRCQRRRKSADGMEHRIAILQVGKSVQAKQFQFALSERFVGAAAMVSGKQLRDALKAKHGPRKLKRFARDTFVGKNIDAQFLTETLAGFEQVSW